MADRSVSVFLKANISDFQKGMIAAGATTKAFTKELNTSTDRATSLTQSLLAVGPALVPITAAAVPAISGLTNQLAFAAAGAGVTALALSGVGDALKATNAYAIEPTKANFDKLQESLDKLGPAGARFVAFLQQIRPEIQRLQNSAQAGLFPGAERGIRELMELLPQAERIVGMVGSAIGDLIAEAGDNLNDPRWREFFNFLETEARPTLLDMGRTLGNFAEGFANLWMAFDPLSDQFSASFLQMSRDFAAWTDGLDQTEGFKEFLDYVSRVGPQVWDTLGSLGNALLQIVEAAAPVGAASLPIIRALADAIGTVADSDLGPAIVGIVSLTSAYSRLIAVTQSANSSAIGGLFGKSAYGGTLKAAKDLPAATRSALAFDAAAARAGMSAKDFEKANGRLGTSAKATAKLVGGAGGLAFVMSDLDEKMGLTNTAMLGLAGSLVGPWGAAIGAGVGLVMDFAAAGDNATEKIKNLTEQVQAAGTSNLQAQRDAVARAYAEAEIGGGNPGDFKEADKAAAALDRNIAAAQEAKFAEAGLSDAMKGTSQATRDQTEALLDNIRVKNEAADAAESIFSAETNYRRALKEAQEQANSNNAGIEGNSEAALRNRDSLDQLAGAWNRQADAGGVSEKQMRAAQRAFIKVAEDMGVSSEAARILADDMFHIPSPNPKVRVDLGQAYTQIANLKKYLKGIKDEEVIINVRRAIESGGGRGHQLAQSAAGNIFNAYGSGGFENHIAQIGDGRVSRVWNEPETKGEAYIPLADDWRRPRAVAIWRETGLRLGMEAFSAGASSTREFAGSPSAASSTGSGLDLDALGLDERTMRRAFRGALADMRFKLDTDGQNITTKIRRSR